MSDEDEISTEPAPAKPGSTPASSSQASVSRRSRLWLKALTASGAIAFVAFKVFPEMLRYFDRAMESSACADWKAWIPSLVLALLVMGALAPTSLRDMGSLVEAIGNLPGKLRGGGK